jgi:hypothetical protein
MCPTATIRPSWPSGARTATRRWLPSIRERTREASPARRVTSPTPSGDSTRRRCAGTATRTRRRLSPRLPRTTVTPTASRATALRSCTRSRRRRPAARAMPPSRSRRPRVTSAVSVATSRTRPSRRPHAPPATRRWWASRTPRSRAAASRAIVRTAPAASPRHLLARPATLRPRCLLFTRRLDTPCARVATCRRTSRRAKTEQGARARATWTSAATSPAQRSAPGATCSGDDSGASRRMPT